MNTMLDKILAYVGSCLTLFKIFILKFHKVGAVNERDVNMINIMPIAEIIIHVYSWRVFQKTRHKHCTHNK